MYPIGYVTVEVHAASRGGRLVRVAADLRCIVCILIMVVILRGTHGAHGRFDKPSLTSRAVAACRMFNGWRQNHSLL